MRNSVRAHDPLDEPTQDLRCIAGEKRMHDHAIRSREPHADQLARRLGEGPAG
jgi:hypothetical protein